MKNTLISNLSFPLVKLTDESLIKLACVKKIIAHGVTKEKMELPNWDDFCELYDTPVNNLLRISINLDLIDRLVESQEDYLKSKQHH